LKLENKTLLIFDLDGTLINSALDLAVAVNYMLETLELETFNEETIHGWVGNGALILVQRALSGNRTIDDNLDNTYVQHALKIFLDFYEANLCVMTKPYPHVVTTLQTLQTKGYTLAIVTNKPFKFVKPILNKLGLDKLFSLILGGDSLKKKKPDPMPLLHVCTSLEVNIKESIMIGDSKNDVLAANACHMDSVGVTYGYNYGESIDVHKPTIIIDDFSTLLELL